MPYTPNTDPSPVWFSARLFLLEAKKHFLSIDNINAVTAYIFHHTYDINPCLVIEHRIYLTKLYSLRAIISLSGNVNTDIINLDTLVGIAKYQKNWKSVLYDWNESEKQIDWDAVYWSIKSRGVNQNKPTQEQIDKFKNIYLEASKELMEKYENCKKLFEGAIEILKRHWIEDRINEYGQCISDTGNTLDMSEKDLEASFRNDIIDAESFWDVQE